MSRANEDAAGPLLFAGDDLRRAGKRKQRSYEMQLPGGGGGGEQTTGRASSPNMAFLQSSVEEKYPMWVISIATFMKMEQLLPHQELLRRGMLCKAKPEHDGRIIFVSHTWAGFSHPDPDGTQLHCLQRVLDRMMNGGTGRKIETNWRQKLTFNNCPHVTDAELKAAVPSMFLWFDYMSMPQPTAGELDIDLGVGEDESNSESKGAAKPKVESSVSHPDDTKQQCTSDHRLGGDKVTMALQAATESIPSYVERCALMMVLAPLSEHADRPGVACCWQSWRGRGWCRMEFLAARLARSELRCMLVKGPEAQPEFLYAADAVMLSAGTGEYTCCNRGHTFEGAAGPTAVTCDKIKIRGVLDMMLNARIEYLFATKNCFEARYFVCLRHWFLRGLPEPSGEATPPETLAGEQAVDALRVLLRWNEEPEEERLEQETGASLLFFAVLADNLEATRHLLEARTGSDAGQPGRGTPKKGKAGKPFLWLAPLIQDWPMLSLHKGITSVHAAMAFASFPVVSALVQATGASEAVLLGRDSKGWGPLLWASVMGRDDNIRNWLQFKGTARDLERAVLGATPLFYAAWLGAGNSEAALEVLQEAGAKAGTITDVGLTLLHEVALNPDVTPGLLARILSEEEVRNSLAKRIRPRTFKWKLVYGVARCMVATGSKSGLLQEHARWYKGTALHLAAMEGNINVVRALVEAGADLRVPDGRGLTPMEACADRLGGRVPPLLEALLAQPAARKK